MSRTGFRLSPSAAGASSQLTLAEAEPSGLLYSNFPSKLALSKNELACGWRSDSRWPLKTGLSRASLVRDFDHQRMITQGQPDRIDRCEGLYRLRGLSRIIDLPDCVRA